MRLKIVGRGALAILLFEARLMAAEVHAPSPRTSLRLCRL